MSSVTSSPKPLPARQFGRYLIVGAWNTLFGYGCYALLTALLQPRFRYGYVAASLLANLINITVAFLGYKWFVFKTKGNYLHEWARCVVVYSGGIVLGTAALPPLVALIRRSTSLTTGAPYLAGAIVTGLTVIYSFVGHKKFSFRSPAGFEENAKR
jgi:putative flippase GtrA